MLNGGVGECHLHLVLSEGQNSTTVIVDPISDHLVSERELHPVSEMERVLNILTLDIKDAVHVKKGVAAAALILMKRNVAAELETSDEDLVVDLASCMDHLSLGDMDLLCTM